IAFVQYFVPMIVPLSLGNGLAVAWLARSMLHSVRDSGWYGRTLSTALLVVAPWLWPAVNVWTSPTRSESAFISPVPEFVEAPGVSEYLKEHTAVGERILIMGSEPEIYYYADRPACTRLIFTFPLTGPYPYAENLCRDFLNDFEQSRPRYVAYCRLDR